MKAYNSGGLWLLTPEQLAQEARDLRTEGDFSSSNPFGPKDTDQDLRAIEAVRSQMNADDDLLCDFNQVLSFTEARRRLKADNQGLYWFEEPIAYHEFRNYNELRQHLSTPLILGENFHGIDHATLQPLNSSQVMRSCLI